MHKNNLYDLSHWMKCTPQPGSHLRVKLHDYFHHGIYIGENKVVHYASETGFSILYCYKMQIMETSLDIFCRGSDIYVRKYNQTENNLLLPTDQIIKNAIKAKGERGYDILFNNCEHFAYRCSLGIEKSEVIQLIAKEKLKKHKTSGIAGFYDSLYLKLKLLQES